MHLNVPIGSRYDCHVSRSLSLNSTYNYYIVYFIVQIEYNNTDRQFHLRQLDDCMAPSNKKRKIADMPGDFKDAIVKMVSSGAQPSNIVRAMKFFPPERQKTFFDPAIFKYLGENQLEFKENMHRDISNLLQRKKAADKERVLGQICDLQDAVKYCADHSFHRLSQAQYDELPDDQLIFYGTEGVIRPSYENSDYGIDGC